MELLFWFKGFSYQIFHFPQNNKCEMPRKSYKIYVLCSVVVLHVFEVVHICEMFGCLA